MHVYLSILTDFLTNFYSRKKKDENLLRKTGKKSSRFVNFNTFLKAKLQNHSIAYNRDKFCIYEIHFI